MRASFSSSRPFSVGMALTGRLYHGEPLGAQGGPASLAGCRRHKKPLHRCTLSSNSPVDEEASCRDATQPASRSGHPPASLPYQRGCSLTIRLRMALLDKPAVAPCDGCASIVGRQNSYEFCYRKLLLVRGANRDCPNRSTQTHSNSAQPDSVKSPSTSDPQSGTRSGTGVSAPVPQGLEFSSGPGGRLAE
jgi:hypothetical protein